MHHVLPNKINEYWEKSVETISTIFRYNSISKKMSENNSFQSNENQDNENIKIKEILSTATYDTCKLFIPPVKYGKVIKVYDGDTITIASQVYGEMYRFQVRLAGIDTPEIKTKNENEKILAQRAKNALTEMVGGKIVELKNVTYDKYGRILADVYLCHGDDYILSDKNKENQFHVNAWLIEKGHAVKYDGGKKVMSEYWMLDA